MAQRISSKQSSARSRLGHVSSRRRKIRLRLAGLEAEVTSSKYQHESIETLSAARVTPRPNGSCSPEVRVGAKSMDDASRAVLAASPMAPPRYVWTTTSACGHEGDDDDAFCVHEALTSWKTIFRLFIAHVLKPEATAWCRSAAGKGDTQWMPIDQYIKDNRAGKINGDVCCLCAQHVRKVANVPVRLASGKSGSISSQKFGCRAHVIPPPKPAVSSGLEGALQMNAVSYRSKEAGLCQFNAPVRDLYGSDVPSAFSVRPQGEKRTKAAAGCNDPSSSNRIKCGRAMTREHFFGQVVHVVTWRPQGCLGSTVPATTYCTCQHHVDTWGKDASACSRIYLVRDTQKI